VTFNVIFEQDSITLCDKRSLTVTITKNGQQINVPISNGEFTVTDPGYYNVIMRASTQLPDKTSTEVITNYSFIIIDPEISTPTFSISKGTNFTIAKLIKSINGQEQDITKTYSPNSSNSTQGSNVLLWLSHEEQGNSIFIVTLRHYDELSDSFKEFTFKIWINNQTPVVLSSINAGTSTKETITINFNPGLIYTQIGKGYIVLNDEVIAEINSDSESYVDTITLQEKGTYWFKIYSDDGRLISSYKYTKTEPMNGITKFILIGVAISALAITILFFLIRRKGRYR